MVGKGRAALGRPQAERAPRRTRIPRRIWSPPAHWGLFAFCAFVVLVVLAFEGIAAHTIGPTSEPHAAAHGPAPLAHSRPLYAARGDRLASVERSPGRRIALTFDDGPDPRWTPRIAAILRAERVPATFFVVGSQAAQHPDLVRMLVRDGNEIGDHTFTHSALSNGPVWERRLQVGLTEAVLAGITGHYARFVRPPYAGTPDTITPQEQRALAQVAERRYYIALSDHDSEDWKRRGVASIVAHAVPRGRTGGVVLLHDGGGDRSQTVAALRRLIPRLRQRGFELVSLAQLAGLAPKVASPPASSWERIRGTAFAWSIRIAFLLVTVLSALLLGIGVVVGARALLLVALAAHHTRTVRRRPSGKRGDWPQVAVIIPAYNEAVGIARTIRSVAASRYPDLEIVVVDDGSTDATASIVARLAIPRVHIIRQDNGGKAAALNTGVEHTDAEIVVMVDGDTLFEPDTLQRLVEPLTRDPDVGAVSGNTKVGNRTHLLGRWQHIEYVMGFNLDRRMYEVLQCTPTVPGAIGAFRREVLDEVGGVPGDTLAEDTDLTLAIGRTGRRIVYADDARAWTEAPSTLGALWRQRYRWSFGTMQAVWKHRGAMLSRDRRERRIGRRALPYILLFQVALPIAAPLVDLLSLYGIVFGDAVRVLAVWTVFNLVQLGIAAFGFRLDREPLRPLWALPLQQFVYRQLMYLVIIESTLSALKGARAGWRPVPRTGDAVVGAKA
jgi:cellulose synthase/poly-beta-1,6-N-acetylglucosamine synthase-like glycosyltransferase/peptidoglycan/xylan/chitin deacetylase (PgdA/CDA1 family)